MVKSIDINSDLGEGIGNDAAIMPFISSCNIASGGHAGDLHSIRETIHLALRHRVKVGAHPSYPDKVNFGRKTIKLSKKELEISILDQINLVKSEVQMNNLLLHHIKLHGALYNDSISNLEIATNMARLFHHYFPECAVFAPYKSQMAIAAKTLGLTVKYEVFADRNYLPDLSLVNRNHQEAFKKIPDEINEHLIGMVEKQQVRTCDGTVVRIMADTICIHGDNPEAVSLAKSINQHFTKKGYHIR